MTSKEVERLKLREELVSSNMQHYAGDGFVDELADAMVIANETHVDLIETAPLRAARLALREELQANLKVGM